MVVDVESKEKDGCYHGDDTHMMDDFYASLSEFCMALEVGHREGNGEHDVHRAVEVIELHPAGGGDDEGEENDEEKDIVFAGFLLLYALFFFLWLKFMLDFLGLFCHAISFLRKQLNYSCDSFVLSR